MNFDFKVADMEVTYLDHMGSDLNVVNAARVSFSKVSEEFDEGRDTKLINYLAKHNHWSPLAHTSVQIRVKAPIFMARQFVKHQIGLVWNEVSRRYVDGEPEFWLPHIWRERAESAKQGSGGEYKDVPWTISSFGYTSSTVREETRLLTQTALWVYKDMIKRGVCPEQARVILPQNTMTEWVWTGSLVAFARVCKLRLNSHAQKEAQELAQKIADVVAPLYPVSWKALMEHVKV